MEPQQDMVVMQKGKMMVVRHGELQPMELVMNLSDGTKVAMDGTVTLPDGTSRMLMDGEALTLDGEPTTLADMQRDPHDTHTGAQEE
jgi:hypothetical protein